jgi:hypothetical protein
LNYVAQRMAPIFEQLGRRYRRTCVLPLDLGQAARVISVKQVCKGTDCGCR